MRGKGDAFAAARPGQRQRVLITGGQKRPLAKRAAAPDGAYGVENVLAGQVEAPGRLGLAGLAAAQRLAGCLQPRPCRAVDGPVHAPAARQRGVGGVDDGVHGHFGDVVANDLQRHGVLPCAVMKRPASARLPVRVRGGEPPRASFRPCSVRTARPAPCRRGSPRPRGPWCQRRSRCSGGRCPFPARCACTRGCAAWRPA